MAIISATNLRLNFGLAPVLDGVSLQIESGERISLVGRNGEGKSSLLKVLSGETRADSGDIVTQKGAVITTLAQEVPRHIAGRVRDVVANLSGDDRVLDVENHEIDAVLHRLDIDGEREFGTLSGGLKRRVLLARALVSQPDLLLLDEPTNHLDIESILWMEDFLVRAGCALLFVTHDRQFLQKLATRIVEIDRGKLSSWACDYPTYLERKAALLESETHQNALFDKKLAQEEVWCAQRPQGAHDAQRRPRPRIETLARRTPGAPRNRRSGAHRNAANRTQRTQSHRSEKRLFRLLKRHFK